MRTAITITLIAVAAATVALSGEVFAAQTPKDPTKYDCRVVVGYRRVFNGRSKTPGRQPILACPYKDKMAASQCETSWLWGMRCKK